MLIGAVYDHTYNQKQKYLFILFMKYFLRCTIYRIYHFLISRGYLHVGAETNPIELIDMILEHLPPYHLIAHWRMKHAFREYIISVGITGLCHRTLGWKHMPPFCGKKDNGKEVPCCSRISELNWKWPSQWEIMRFFLLSLTLEQGLYQWSGRGYMLFM